MFGLDPCLNPETIQVILLRFNTGEIFIDRVEYTRVLLGNH